MTFLRQRSAGRGNFIGIFLLVLPLAGQAAVDEELSLMRAQLQALSTRLERLESENRQLKAAHAGLLESTQQTAANVAIVNEKTAAVVASIQQQSKTSDWTDKIHWQGDFRYRYERFDIERAANRNRNRLRARAAMHARVTNSVEVGLGLASGGLDPVSSNQTLGGGGSSKGLNLDLAYFDWSGLTDTHVTAGKFSNFLHKSGKNSLLWDGDWRPEGVGFRWDNGRFFGNGLGTWIESDSKKDQSFAYALQAGMKLPIGESLKLTAGFGYYDFDTKGSGSFFGGEHDFFGNSFDPATSTYLFDYEELEVFADLGFNLSGKPLVIFADFVQNQAVDDNNMGYAVGLKYGKAKNKGQWEFAYVYQKLEADAVLGLLADSDFGGGGTDSKGHIFKSNYAIARNWNAAITYFLNDKNLKSGNPADFGRLQVDMILKY